MCTETSSTQNRQSSGAPPTWNTTCPAGQSRVDVNPTSYGFGSGCMIGPTSEVDVHGSVFICTSARIGTSAVPLTVNANRYVSPFTSGTPSTPTIDDHAVLDPPGTSTHRLPDEVSATMSGVVHQGAASVSNDPFGISSGPSAAAAGTAVASRRTTARGRTGRTQDSFDRLRALSR